jgi:ubiquitin-small subunit ribosomal protein S27Ae
MKKIEIFKVEGDKITRVRRHCPKCGSGVFLAEHKNRFSCGRCGYTEYKPGGKEQTSKPVSVTEGKTEVKKEKIEKPSEPKKDLSVKAP